MSTSTAMPPEKSMNEDWKTALWGQFGAAIDMLENAMRACPDPLWHSSAQQPQFWYLAFHTLFWLDVYSSDSLETFVPPAPFTLAEMDPAGLYPERPYTKEELQSYLEHGRKKCKTSIESLTEETAGSKCGFESVGTSVLGLVLSNMRHVQHHAGQLNLILRQQVDSASRWVKKTTK